jgi:hypothetical protein
MRFKAWSMRFKATLAQSLRGLPSCDRAQENKGSFAHHPRTFSPSSVVITELP